MALMETEEIMQILPHRYPMLMVDRILESDEKSRIVGQKNVTINEPFFEGHFPGKPVMPGVLQLEAMAQTGGILLMKANDVAGGVPYFMSLDKVKFRKVVQPGDTMNIEVNMTKARATTARFRAVTTVDGDVVSEAELTCMITFAENG